MKQKLFLAHIRPVQSQLADAKQRYTIIYYCKTTDRLESELLDIQEMPDHVLTYNETANSASIASGHIFTFVHSGFYITAYYSVTDPCFPF